jgi:predicted DNA-binding protein with PD1-like motif
MRIEGSSESSPTKHCYLKYECCLKHENKEPDVKSKLLYEEGGRKTFAVIFDKGDEAKKGLTDFAKREGLGVSQITAIGAFSDVTLGYFDRQKMEYLKIPVREQVEVLSLLGDIVADKGEPSVHAHVVAAGKRDGSTVGGHLLEAHVWPTLKAV